MVVTIPQLRNNDLIAKLSTMQGYVADGDGHLSVGPFHNGANQYVRLDFES